MNIRKGNKYLWHLPKILKVKNEYKRKFIITQSLLSVTDACDSGWSKLWGVSFGHVHLNSSYRFVFRNTKDGLKIGYYGYVCGVSPQEDKSQKGTFNLKDIKIGDEMVLKINFNYNTELIIIHNGIEYKQTLVKCNKFSWLRFELFPNLKCKQENNIIFNLQKVD